MKKLSISFLYLTLLLAGSLTFGLAQDPRPVFQGQGPSEQVDTKSRQITFQVRRAYEFAEDGVGFSNQFPGARLNSIERTGPLAYTIHIEPENAPINMSPWYAFKIWADTGKEINVRLSYPEYARHRYDPQISNDGRKWKLLEKARITEIGKDPASTDPTSRPLSVILKLRVGKGPTWVSAQELQNSWLVNEWMERITKKRKLGLSELGKSKEGRAIKMLTIGRPESQKMMLVISRQHPPEVTGYFAMQSFVETIAGDSNLAKNFRKDWTVYVVPLMNPDGVDQGHWRHNLGGIDLNRDWTLFNQPEDKLVSEFLKRREIETDGKFYFGIDFHSTWDDIYYPMARGIDGNMPGLVFDWLSAIKKAIPGYDPNIRPSDRLLPAIVSRNYFLASHGMEALVFEIGDNTPRDFIRKKGRVGAEELMKLLMARSPKTAGVPTSVQ